MSGAVSGFGTLLKRENTAGGGVYTAIAEIKSISGPNLSVETIDVTHMQSPSGYREFIASFKDGGEMTFTMNFLPDDATQNWTAGLLKTFNDRSMWNYQCLFPDPGATLVTFAALITAFAPNAQIDSVLEVNVTLKISGAPVWS